MSHLLSIQKNIRNTNQIKDTFLNTSLCLLDYTKKEYSPKIQSIIHEYDLDRIEKFNIFETISDLYKREKFHSDILYSILSDKTPEIGKIYYKEILKAFILMIDFADFIIDDTFNISKEVYNVVWDGTENREGFIDILMLNAHKQAIIIENKINDAPDRPDQLVRYLSFVKEQLFSNDPSSKIIVVYLTLIPGKIPKIDEYNKFFSTYIEMLEDSKNGEDGKILKYRSAVDKNSRKGSLVNFLSNCLNIFNQEMNKSVLLKKLYLEQYMSLLCHLGGTIAMLEYQKELLRNIYSSEENIKATKDIIDVFSVDKNINQFINDCLKPFVIPLGFSFEDNWIYRLWDDTHTDFIFVNGNFRKFQVGFGSAKIIEKDKQTVFTKILEETFKDNIPIDEWSATDAFVWIKIEPLAGKSNMDEFLKYCTSYIPRLKEVFLNKQIN